ncbi:MAG: RluA family pseudouridine synthase [Tenericutes bacterium HGW-Tenericutes-8]|nr:MAG: RluA family pseudouridine synthase [Tenericutes bacterium HGW-Tenericutes-8]
MKKVAFEITEYLNNKSIKDFFNYANFGSKHIHLLKMAKAITVNQSVVNDTYILKHKDILEIDFGALPQKPVKPSFKPIDILYEDQDMVIVHKPTKVLTHEDESDFDALTNRVNGHYQQLNYPISVLPAHRIDYETSGMVIFGKHPLAMSYLSNLFEQKTITKVYQARIPGDFENKQGIIHQPIGNDRHQNKMMVSKTGKAATSIYRWIKKIGEDNLVEIEIKGGRKHQIRVHLAYIKHPIKGDILYGTKSDRLYLHFYKVVMPKFLTNATFEHVSNAPFALE